MSEYPMENLSISLNIIVFGFIAIWRKVDDHTSICDNDMLIEIAFLRIAINANLPKTYDSFTKPFRSRNATHSSIAAVPFFDSFCNGHNHTMIFSFGLSGEKGVGRQVDQTYLP